MFIKGLPLAKTTKMNMKDRGKIIPVCFFCKHSTLSEFSPKMGIYSIIARVKTHIWFFNFCFSTT